MAYAVDFDETRKTNINPGGFFKWDGYHVDVLMGAAFAANLNKKLIKRYSKQNNGKNGAPTTKKSTCNKNKPKNMAPAENHHINILY